MTRPAPDHLVTDGSLKIACHTRLTKPVARRTPWRAPYGVARQVVAILYPGGLLGLREHGRRKEVKVELSTIYTRALLAERRAARKGRGR